MYKIIFSLI